MTQKDKAIEFYHSREEMDLGISLYKDTFMAIIEIASAPGWISVEDEPKENGWFNIVEYGTVNSGYYFKSLDAWGISEYPEKERIYPSHYAPLPEPPKEKGV